LPHLPFRKLHGLGNDFVVVDGLDQSLTERLTQILHPERVREICDRHSGVGADGILIVLPARDPRADLRMRVLNADGSEPETCGNGIRCVAKAAREHIPLFAGRDELAIETGGGLVRCLMTMLADGGVSAVTVDMGQPSFSPARLPMVAESPQWIDQPFAIDGRVLRSTAVSLGNPHFVFFLDEGEDPTSAVSRLGPRVEYDPRFPNRTNVEFVRWTKTEAITEVWERGCGRTQACGTGACAVAAAAVATGRSAADSWLDVRLPGGVLQILVEAQSKRIWMKGPAIEVYSGRLPY
jgi:diaminopimelate epimerase